MDTQNEERNSIEFNVVVNGEHQYSIWPSDKPVPLGWEKVGSKGNEDFCLKFIESLWTDMRPNSLKQSMENSV